MNNIVTISPGIPVEPRAAAQKLKANNAKSTVAEVGSRMATFDQLDGVDLSPNKGEVDVSNAKLPPKGLANSIIGAVVPEQVSGFAKYTEDGQLDSLYTSSHDIGGTKDLQFQRNPDGSQVYAVSTPTGQTTVRQNGDGTLFMMESPMPSEEDWKAMNSADFTPPVLAPGEAAFTVGDVKNSYIENAKRQRDLVNGLFNADTREASFKNLAKGLFRNPFSR